TVQFGSLQNGGAVVCRTMNMKYSHTHTHSSVQFTTEWRCSRLQNHEHEVFPQTPQMYKDRVSSLHTHTHTHARTHAHTHTHARTQLSMPLNICVPFHA